MLKIYSDKSINEAYGLPYPVMLYPFFGSLDDPKDKDSGRFDSYCKIARTIFSVVNSLDEADIAVLPFDWLYIGSVPYSVYSEFVDRANDNNKQIIIFHCSDSEADVPIDNSVIIRTNFCRSKRKSNEFACPAWSSDFTEKYFHGELQVRYKSPAPSIGYCGYVDYRTMTEYVINKLSRKTLSAGAKLRGKVIRSLQGNNQLQLNFVLREKFEGACDEATRAEYVSNMINSDYALIMRGAGNFSYRFYEALSCGRIPVFVDTDCVLPFDNIIDWKKYCLFVDEKDIKSIASKIIEFHNTISEIDFVKLQYAIRTLYEDWIRPVGFYKNLQRYILNQNPVNEI